MKKKSEAKDKKKNKDMKHPNRMMAFRQGIQKRAREMGHRISVDQFAAAVGITTSYWRMLEHGEYDPKEDLKEKIAEVLERPVDAIFPDRMNRQYEPLNIGAKKKFTTARLEHAVLSKMMSVKPIWEIFDAIISKVPEEVFEKLPPDGASNLDYYLYGRSKKR